ncbi:MAG: hypothetical protein NTV81_00545 [Candidatus Komeilibacteria bacterium]|nr:hypothetical protein [Candidatus Komeilibacteria bacterium]
MQQFFREVWLSFQPKQYYRFVAAGKTSSRWFFLILLGLTYTLVTASIFFWQVGFAAKTTFDQVGHLLSTWPDKVEFVIRNHQLTIQNLPQPYQQTIVGPRGPNWLIRFDVASQNPSDSSAGWCRSFDN